MKISKEATERYYRLVLPWAIEIAKRKRAGKQLNSDSDKNIADE